MAGFALLGGLLGGCDREARVRVACEGDSITFGHKVKNRGVNCYPGQLQRLLGRRYAVRNFGVNGATVIAQGDYPYVTSNEFREAVGFDPHIVVLMLGTNDTKEWNWKKNGSFVMDGKALLDRHAPAAKCFLCLPPPAFPENYGIRGDRIQGEVVPRLREIAALAGADLIDLHTPFLGRAEWFPDKVHPTENACAEMAGIVASAIRVRG